MLCKRQYFSHLDITAPISILLRTHVGFEGPVVAAQLKLEILVL